MKSFACALLVASASAHNLRTEPASVFDDLMKTLSEDTPATVPVVKTPDATPEALAGSVANIFGGVKTADIPPPTDTADATGGTMAQKSGPCDNIDPNDNACCLLQDYDEQRKCLNDNQNQNEPNMGMTGTANNNDNNDNNDHNDHNMPPCVTSCGKEGPSSCAMAKEWMSTGCAMTCDTQTKGMLVKMVCGGNGGQGGPPNTGMTGTADDSDGANDRNMGMTGTANQQQRHDEPATMGMTGMGDSMSTNGGDSDFEKEIKEFANPATMAGMTGAQSFMQLWSATGTANQQQQGDDPMGMGMTGMGMTGMGMTGMGMTGTAMNHDGPPDATDVMDQAHDEQMDKKVADFEATATCVGADDCVEACKQFSATDPDVDDNMCTLPGLFDCGLDNLCNVNLPKDNHHQQRFAQLTASSLKKVRGPTHDWRANNPGMMAVNGVGDLWREQI